mmetsp:Transcript_16451/g.52366  ORF Transcript_16451/g.52366 Transcript_16451/m.52366 type:complete len:215 (-) Transcript_16451:2049-2693(-)
MEGQAARVTVPVSPSTSCHTCSHTCGQMGASTTYWVRRNRRTSSACMGTPSLSHTSRYVSRARCMAWKPEASASRKAMRAKAASAAAAASAISALNTRSKGVHSEGGVSRSGAPSPAPRSCACAALAHSISTYSLRMAMLATSGAKLASSRPSPASASAKRTASALHRSTACSMVRKLPLLLDIFSASNMTWPLVKKERGQRDSGSPAHTQAWL